ncbi:hypothetical protein GRJ2_000293400 [Grus japonensis]|uniref:Secreted protein n=1 Tax=Grus japonensis TaxID=30415 RepID=A0ABC9VZJ6_GRUJA
MRGVVSSRAARPAIGRVRVCVVTRVAAVRVPIAAAACQCDEDWHPGFSPLHCTSVGITPLEQNNVVFNPLKEREYLFILMMI